MINKLSKQIHQNAIDKGFFENDKNIGEMLCLIHSEVSEALEADRKEKYYKGGFYGWTNMRPGLAFDDFIKERKVEFEEKVKNTFEDELADIMIRIMDLAAFKAIDLEKHIDWKMKYNSFREKYHGKKY
jgi:NTP pyrophosphatase (non-canonical NTP hydrolase)